MRVLGLFLQATCKLSGRTVSGGTSHWQDASGTPAGVGRVASVVLAIFGDTSRKSCRCCALARRNWRQLGNMALRWLMGCSFLLPVLGTHCVPRVLGPLLQATCELSGKKTLATLLTGRMPVAPCGRRLLSLVSASASAEMRCDIGSRANAFGAQRERLLMHHSSDRA